MRLLYITNQISGPGGLERVLSIKASYFADQLDYEVHIVTTNETNSELFFAFSKKLFIHNIRLNRNPVPYIWGYINKLKNVIKRIDPDIVLVCDDGIKGILLPRLIGKYCPFIYERHVSIKVALNTPNKSILTHLRSIIINSLMHWGGKKFDVFVVLTNGNLNEWKLSNLKVIPNPLPFQPKKFSTQKNKIAIAVGKHSFQKGYERLIAAWSKVTNQYPDWKLEIYGSSNRFNDLRPQIKRLDLEEHVLLLDPVRNIEEKLRNASIHILTSRYEGFGMVIIEAQACGLPSVSFDCNYGPADIIDHNENGILVEEGNIEELSISLMNLIKNENVRRRMANNARKSVKKYYVEPISKKWIALFNDLRI